MGLSLVESHHLDDFDHESEDCQQNWPYDGTRYFFNFYCLIFLILQQKMQSIFKLVLVLLALISTIEGCILSRSGCIACYARCTILVEDPPAYAACIAACTLVQPGQ